MSNKMLISAKDKKKDDYGRALFLNFSVEHHQDYPYGISF